MDHCQSADLGKKDPISWFVMFWQQKPKPSPSSLLTNDAFASEVLTSEASVTTGLFTDAKIQYAFLHYCIVS